jgi:hypothetical protein
MVVEDGGLTPYLQLIYRQSGAEWQDVTHIKILPFNTLYAEAIKTQLQQHGCQIEEYEDYYILTFPPGTRKKLAGLVTMVEPYTIRFPDGYDIRQEYDRGRGISIILVPKV